MEKRVTFEYDYDDTTDVATLWFFNPGQSRQENVPFYGINLDDVLTLFVDARNNDVRGLEIVRACENRVNMNVVMLQCQKAILENASKPQVDWEAVFSKAIKEHENDLVFH